jgi:dipeptidyl aminopeptidase/acylaminoacyl peptidase
VVCFVAVSPVGALAQNGKPDTGIGVTVHANYDLASKWTQQKVGKLVFDTSVTPHWLESSDRFWYGYETNAGKSYYIVDPARKSKTPLFDNVALAATLSTLTHLPFDSQHIPIRDVKFVRKDAAVQFGLEVPKDADIPNYKAPETTDKEAANSKTKTVYFEYDLTTSKATLLSDFQPPKKPRWASVSPDEGTIVFAKNNNLFTMDAENYEKARKNPNDASIVETQLTTDGETDFSYARRLLDDDKKELKISDRDVNDKDKMSKLRLPAIQLFWSKDSRRIATVRQDQRKVADLFLVNNLASPRPTLETYKYAMPGEENVPQAELSVITLESKRKVVIKADRFKDQIVGISADEISNVSREKEKTEPTWVGGSSDKFYFTRFSRDRHRLDICETNANTGETRVVIEERLNTYIESKPLRTINNGQEFIHWSERDGWGHYYLFDGNGNVKNQITSGEYVTDAIVGVDEKQRVMYFTANGHEKGEDPYYTHLYRVNLDGSGFKLLDPGNASHAVSMSDSMKYFVDNASRVNTAPEADVYDQAGAKLLHAETTDVAALLEAGFQYPEPFEVKADDGVTALYGVMYKPFDFDAKKKYPIIAFVYPGPQTESVTKTFTPKNERIALAQAGFIVIEVGNRGGNPQRSKWYHNYGYGNLRDYGLADKKAAIEQLARRHSFIDIDKVGIYGHSGGGFMSAAAMLVYPDFFKVAVSESGNHENNIYNRNWSETNHGVKEVTDKDGNIKFEYSIDKNSEIAKNLKGHLLLTTGDIDDNVHPANTVRLADALIKANKRFDFFVFPGKRHAYGDVNDYLFWMKVDYFSKHLLGESTSSVDMIELQREKEQGGDKKPGRAGGSN